MYTISFSTKFKKELAKDKIDLIAIDKSLQNFQSITESSWIIVQKIVNY